MEGTMPATNTKMKKPVTAKVTGFFLLPQQFAGVYLIRIILTR